MMWLPGTPPGVNGVEIDLICPKTPFQHRGVFFE